MKTPVCESCIETNSLCQGCQQKLDSGELSEIDLTLSRVLYQHRADLPSGENVGFQKTMPLGDLLLVFTETPAALIGRGGKIVNALGKEVNKKIKVIDVNSGAQEQFSEVLLPAKLLGVNQVFKGGETEYRIRVSRKDAMRLPVTLSELNTVAEKLFGKKATVVFE